MQSAVDCQARCNQSGKTGPVNAASSESTPQKWEGKWGGRVEGSGRGPATFDVDMSK